MTSTSFSARANGLAYLIADPAAGPAQTVFDDGLVDTLITSEGQDWFLFQNTGDPRKKDRILFNDDDCDDGWDW